MTSPELSQNPGWVRHRITFDRHVDLSFWIIFLLLNGLLFLPAALANLETSSLLPPINFSENNPLRLAQQLFVWRNNIDLFRLHAELTLLTAAWMLLPWPRWPRWERLYHWLFAFVFFLGLAYNIYESVVFTVYQEEAVLYAHAAMLADGLGFLLRHLPLPNWQITILFFIAAALIFVLAALLRALTRGIPRERLSRWSKIILTGLAVLAAASLIRFQTNLASPKSVVSSLSHKLTRSIAASIALRNEVNSSAELPYGQYLEYSKYDLLEKPDIYLIFIESYGSILYKRPAFHDSYTKQLADLERQLSDQGWHASSALSESTTWGGGSWLAYTSALFGLRVDNHPQYVSLFSRFQEQDYPDLGYTLRSQGYEYVRATSLAAELPEEDWQDYVDFFGVDRWIRYRDLDYQGMHYGWGPSPPDQYVLNAVHEQLKEKNDQPLFLFWITQNSHYPWRAVPRLAEDWRAMNDGNAVVTVFEDEETSLKGRQQNYLQAISYELSFLTDFILEEASDDALFILIGDHQPGYVTRRSDGYDTPVHVISKDASLLEHFAPYGFEKGLTIANMEPVVRHEGLYSLLMHALLQQYGYGGGQPPPYLPQGITVDNN